MQKRKVLQFFTLLGMFAVLLGVMQVMRYGSLTGYSALHPQDSSYALAEDTLLIYLESYIPIGDVLKVSYRIVDKSGNGDEGKVSASLAGENGEWEVIGEQSIALPDGSASYLMDMVLPVNEEDDAVLTLEVSDGERSATIKKFFSLAPAGITGFAILGDELKPYSDILSIILIVLIILGLIIYLNKKHKDNLHYSHKVQRAGLENYRHRYIPLDLSEKTKKGNV